MRVPGGGKGGDGELRYIVVVSVLYSVRAEERLWKMGELLAGLLVACSQAHTTQHSYVTLIPHIPQTLLEYLPTLHLILHLASDTSFLLLCLLL